MDTVSMSRYSFTTASSDRSGLKSGSTASPCWSTARYVERAGNVDGSSKRIVLQNADLTAPGKDTCFASGRCESELVFRRLWDALVLTGRTRRGDFWAMRRVAVRGDSPERQVRFIVG